MTIYVVQPGDTLSSIATTYGVSEETLRVNNEITTNNLVIGQAIVILFPEQTHTVVEGETLLSIANQYDVSVIGLLQNNPFLMGNQSISVGDVLVISYEGEKIGQISVNGYLYPFIEREVLIRTIPYLTYLTIFGYGFTTEGELIGLDDTEIIQIARDFGVAPIMLLTTLTEQGTFNNELSSAIFQNQEAQNNLINNVLANLKEKNYSGLDIDFEYINPEDKVAYVDFIRNVTTKLNAEGFQVIVALAPKTSGEQVGRLYEAHDYPAIGAVANAVLVMTYEWGNTYSEPMAVAPINKVREVLNYAVSVIPPEKIFMGIPNYGYDWTLPYVKGTPANSIRIQEAVELAAEVGAEIEFDTIAQTPFFYYNVDGVNHVVWFEDARSIEAKVRLANELGLRGLSYWNIMKYFPQNWLVVNDLFNINKII